MGDNIFSLGVLRYKGKQGKRMRLKTRHTRAMDRAYIELGKEISYYCELDNKTMVY
jgi:hypothetical protein